jgi:hypothetical protein
MNKKHVTLIAGAVLICLILVVSNLVREADNRGGSQGPGHVVTESVPMEPEPEPRAIDIPEDAVRFDLSYRGLSYEKGSMQYNFSYGYGLGKFEETPFLKAVQERAVNETKVVYFPGFTQQAYSVIEYQDTQAEKFYFDCNGDEKLAEDEVFTPINVTDSGSSKRCDFVTSDFTVTDQKGRQYRFRARLGVSFYNGQTEPQCMWSPACVMEGSGPFKGKDTKFVLKLGNMDGQFTQWGRSQFSLIPSDEDTGGYVPQSRLSSLIFHDGTFYQFRFEGRDEEAGKVTAVLVEDETPTGKLAVKLEGKEAMDAAVSYASVSGADDKTVQFSIRNSQEYPADQYVLNSGQFSYGTSGDHDYSVDFSKGPSYTITADTTASVVMGNCDVAVSSIDENRRYYNDVKELAEFDKDMSVYLSLKVRGVGGALYTRFKQRDGNDQYQDIKPHMTITDASGKTIESKDLEYG